MGCPNWGMRIRWEKRGTQGCERTMGQEEKKCPELGSGALREPLGLVG